jgi:hypothetical protein
MPVNEQLPHSRTKRWCEVANAPDVRSGGASGFAKGGTGGAAFLGLKKGAGVFFAYLVQLVAELII